jgi:tRNA(His) guanylyltransferase
MKGDSLGDRMKDYEQRAFRSLTRRIPLLLRMDGKAFHTWTEGLERPFDKNLRYCMDYAMLKVCSEVEGARFGYSQSDEISILMCDYQDFDTQAWFDYRGNKIESVAASICTAAFNHACLKYLPDQYNKKGPAIFDARAWNLPKEEVSNYVLWRQRDCEKNSVSQLAMAHFSHKSLMGKNGSQKQDMLMLEKGINWNDLETFLKRGSAAFRVTMQVNDTTRSKWVVDYAMPIITQDRAYVERWVEDIPTLQDRSFKDSLIGFDNFILMR